MEGASGLATCPRCGAFVTGPPPCPMCGYAPGVAPQPAGYAPLLAPIPWPPFLRIAQDRYWRRTRAGLAVTALGLLLAWLPFVSVLGALFVSLGSSLLVLGARHGGPRHGGAVGIALLLLAFGGIAIVTLVGSFLWDAYDAAHFLRPMRVLEGAGNWLVWGTLPPALLVSVGFALQIAFLVPRRQVRVLVGFTVLMAVTAVAATLLTAGEPAALGTEIATTARITDFLFRVSLWRLVEGPAYVGLAWLYLSAHTSLRTLSPAVPSAALPAAVGKG